MTIGYDSAWNKIPRAKLKTSDGTIIKNLSAHCPRMRKHLIFSRALTEFCAPYQAGTMDIDEIGSHKL